jgi:hypothetical protein
LAGASASASAPGGSGETYPHHGYSLNCAGAHSYLCADVYDRYVVGNGNYVGHDEPSLLWYSNKAGSGNNETYAIRLPKEPPVLPKPNGTGGTFNFQLHPAFWLGMAMCDTQSFPEYTNKCPADSDANIYNSPNPSSPRYIGKHPGTAFMEMQFYPPGWAPFQLPGGTSCAARQWCAALTIDSFSSDPADHFLNPTCADRVGVEYVNFAFITKSGHSQAPANPVDATGATFTPNRAKDLFMNSGDILQVAMADTANGLRVVVKDLTTGQTGSMTASKANDFGQVKYEPTGKSCVNIPYDFHPMYSTSSPATRVPWAAHSYNTAFSDEIGHFEGCLKVNAKKFTCTKPVTGQTAHPPCLPGSISLRVHIGGCAGADTPDFSGPSYLFDWPGTGTAAHDAKYDPQPYIFASPTFNGTQRYSRIGFETDMPRIEYSDFGGSCNPTTGAHCVNPPKGAKFYPIYSTRSYQGECLWQFGGPHIPGTTNNFGGSSKTEFSTNLLRLLYPSVNAKGKPAPEFKYEDFRHILSNPC